MEAIRGSSASKVALPVQDKQQALQAERRKEASELEAKALETKSQNQQQSESQQNTRAQEQQASEKPRLDVTA